MHEVPDLQVIRDAHRRISPIIAKTPVFISSTLNTIVDGKVFLKCENFQRVGAFKFRGASNAIFSLLDAHAKNGVVTHSSGNHAQAVALAARMRKIPAYIVVPEGSPQVKVSAVKNYGGKITFCKPTLEAREQTARRVMEETNAVLIHPYNDFRVVAGQATASLELMEEVGDLDLVLAPVGGGGLVAGTALCVTELSPGTHVIAVEPEGAKDTFLSFNRGEIVPVTPNTIADGLRVTVGARVFPVIQKRVHDVILVTEEEIIEAMRFVFERMKIVIEPSAAVPVAALLARKIPSQYRRIGVILSGGNVDLASLPFGPQ